MCIYKLTIKEYYELTKRYLKKIAIYLNSADFEDLVQSALLAMWVNLKMEHVPKSYIYTHCQNAFRNYLRNSSRRIKTYAIEDCQDDEDNRDAFDKFSHLPDNLDSFISYLEAVNLLDTWNSTKFNRVLDYAEGKPISVHRNQVILYRKQMKEILLRAGLVSKEDLDKR